MKTKELLTKLIEDIFPLCKNLGIRSVEYALGTREEAVSVIKKTAGEDVACVDIQTVIKTGVFQKNNEPVFYFTLKQKNSDIFCSSNSIAGEDGVHGIILFQKNQPFTDTDKENLRAIISLLTKIEQNATSPNEAIDKKYKDELMKMRTAQANMFPKFENVKGLDVASVYLPVELMSGTFVDVKVFNQEVYQLAACNVSGYDASSSFIGAAIRTLIHSSSNAHMVPSALIEIVINKLHGMIAHIHSLVYLTVVQINTASGKIKASAYGDICTVYVNRQKKGLVSLGNTQIGRELAKRNVGKDMVFTLGAGDILLYYSKGTLNAETEDGRMQYGESRLQEQVLKHIESPSISIVHEIVNSIYEFTNYSPVKEDVLLICVKKS